MFSVLVEKSFAENFSEEVRRIFGARYVLDLDVAFGDLLSQVVVPALDVTSACPDHVVLCHCLCCQVVAMHHCRAFLRESQITEDAPQPNCVLRAGVHGN